MNNLEAFTIFCEDIRWESNGAPMILGIMSPAIHASEFPLKLSQFSVVTFFRAGLNLDKIEPQLSVLKIFDGKEEEIGAYNAEYAQEERDREGKQWVAVATLPLEAVALEAEQSLCARLTVGEQKWETYLTVLSEAENTARS